MKHLYRIIFLLIIINNLNAQNDEGEIEDAQILIEKNSRIILQKSDKSVDKIDLEVNNFKKFKTSFEIINNSIPFNGIENTPLLIFFII